MYQPEWRMNVAKARGFTLLELLVTLLVMGIIAVWGIPSFQALGERTARTGEINRLQTALGFARQTAITQRRSITLCPIADSQTTSRCGDNWSQALMVVRGDQTEDIATIDILRTFPASERIDIRYSRGWRRIRYDALGHSSGYNGRFILCPQGEKSRSRGSTLILSQLGRWRVAPSPTQCTH
ncbi:MULTISPECIES: GspH/FimT family pseudopilin [Halomonadaceae]|uniref:Type II secretion system protein H n=1 Tax=Vreelandella janggokensis TaxID=370767 RepID=A0ABT4IYI4_9GAMM|nr:MULTISPECIES: GspH/FimT family pseudopilin [Halomonas]MCZ0928743.1 GspH/FimT family pseudopilin [Halomonas janggokensis]QPL45608.1 GspH/FimT family pseudopilin [Halomonas sp. A40-4]